jgi:hypothetical protein
MSVRLSATGCEETSSRSEFGFSWSLLLLLNPSLVVEAVGMPKSPLAGKFNCIRHSVELNSVWDIQKTDRLR